MHRHYSQPIQSVSVGQSVSMGKTLLNEPRPFSSWFWMIWLYLTLVASGIVAMIFRMTLSLM